MPSFVARTRVDDAAMDVGVAFNLIGTRHADFKVSIKYSLHRLVFVLGENDLEWVGDERQASAMHFIELSLPPSHHLS